MNKKTLKIAGLALGLSMAVAGVGIATTLSHFGSNPISVSAVEQAYYTFATEKNSSNTTYASTYDVTIDGVKWNVPGNQNMNGFVRIGGKGGSSNSSVSTFDRIITGKDSLGEAITKVKVNHNGRSNANAVVNSVTLKVASDSAFTEDVSEVTLNPTIAVSTAGYFTFEPQSASEWAKDSYYKFTFNMTLTGKSNYGLDVTSIVFYQDVVSEDYATDLSVSPSSISPNKGASVLDTLGGLNITARKNGGDATAYSNYSAKITRRDDSVEDVLAATIFKTGDKKVTITANDPTELSGSTYASCDITTDVQYTPSVVVGNSYALVSGGNVFTCALTSTYGTSAEYTKTPAVYAFKVEEGLYNGTVSFKILSGTNANKYISWTGTSAQLAISDTKTAFASWVAYNDGEKDITANAANEAAILRFNSGSPRFSAYIGDTGVDCDYLLLGTVNVDIFSADYMKMATYDPSLDNTGGTNACYGTDGTDGYYATAKEYYNLTLTTAERTLICDEDGLYATAYDRLQKWAVACGDSIDTEDNFILKAPVAAGLSMGLTSNDSGNLVLIITIISIGAVAAGGFFLVQRKRKQN